MEERDEIINPDKEEAAADLKEQEPQNTDDSMIKTTFTKEELLADYDQCWELMEENYPFFPVLKKRGINAEQFPHPQTVAVYASLAEGTAGSEGYFEADVETEYDAELKAAYFHFKTFWYEASKDDSPVKEYLAFLEESLGRRNLEL